MVKLHELSRTLILLLCGKITWMNVAFFLPLLLCGLHFYGFIFILLLGLISINFLQYVTLFTEQLYIYTLKCSGCVMSKIVWVLHFWVLNLLFCLYGFSQKVSSLLFCLYGFSQKVLVYFQFILFS